MSVSWKTWDINDRSSFLAPGKLGNRSELPCFQLEAGVRFQPSLDSALQAQNLATFRFQGPHHPNHNWVITDFFRSAVIYGEECGTVVADRDSADISNLAILNAGVTGPPRGDTPIGQLPTNLFVLNDAVLDLGGETGVLESGTPDSKEGIIFALKSRALVRTLCQDKTRRNIKGEAELSDTELLPRLSLKKRAAK